MTVSSLSVIGAFVAAALAAPMAWAAPAADPSALAQAIEKAWQTGDVEGYLAVWRFASPETREAEKAFAQEEFSSEQVQLHIELPPAIPAEATKARVSARFFAAREPRGRVTQAVLGFEKGADGWTVVSREDTADIDGLIHLSLDRSGYNAKGLTLRLPDLVVRMKEGAIFTAPASVGPTVVVFSGRAVVEFRPTPLTEQEQLRQYTGKKELAQPIRNFFLRLHPAKFFEWLGVNAAHASPDTAVHFAAAQRYFDENVTQLYVLDAPLPRSPWWLVPPLGDAALVFEGPKGPLTLALDSNSPEGVSLIDRERRRQICLYAADGRSVRYNDSEARMAHVAHHDITLAVDRGLRTIRAEDTLKLAVRQPTGVVRFRLHEGLAVESVSSPGQGALLFFRVRGQDTVMVSLGSLGLEGGGEVTLRIRYRGAAPPAFLEEEASAQLEQAFEQEVPIEELLVLTNRYPWYPSIGTDDYATARVRFDLPVGLNAVTGGRRVSSQAEGDRLLIEYRQEQPGKYISAAIGRLFENGSANVGSTHITAYGVPRRVADLPRRVEEARSILTYYESIFGPVPYSRINLVLMERIAPGGHSPPGMIILAERPVLARRTLRDDPASFWNEPGFFLAHELAHQWWGHGISGENYHERWLSEGFAQYAAALWTRHTRGDQVFLDILGRMNKWALKMNDEGPISLGYRLGHIKGDPQVYRALVYNKAALVLHLLRGVVGDTAFYGALKKLQSERRFTTAGSGDVRRALEAASGRELTGYFEEWVEGTTLPTLTLRYKTQDVAGKGQTTVQMETENLPGPLPVTFDLVADRTRRTHRVSVSPPGGEWSFDGAGGVKKVEVRSDELPLVRVRHEKGNN